MQIEPPQKNKLHATQKLSQKTRDARLKKDISYNQNYSKENFS